MPVYTNLNAARLAFHRLNLKKTGKNTFAKYSYYELSDILPAALQICAEHDLCPTISFTDTTCIMRLVDTVDGSHCFFESPIADAQTKGSSPIQAIGSTHTYMRRYMWVLCLEIVEHDGVEAVASKGPYVPPAKPEPLINEAQWMELVDLCEATSTDVEAMCKYYKVAALDQLPKSKFDAAKANLVKKVK